MDRLYLSMQPSFSWHSWHSIPRLRRDCPIDRTAIFVNLKVEKNSVWYQMVRTGSTIFSKNPIWDLRQI